MAKIIFAMVLMWGTFVAPTQTLAQGLYKCAGVYQDRPCESAIQSQYSSTTGGFTRQKANPRADARCAEAGGIVQKIREDLDAGKTVAAVSNELTKSNGGKLLNKRVQDVVRDISVMRGTPIQVRYEYEGDCTDQRAMLTQPRGYGSTVTRSAGAADTARSAAQEERPSAQGDRAAAQAARAAAQAARAAAQDDRAAVRGPRY